MAAAMSLAKFGSAVSRKILLSRGTLSFPVFRKYAYWNKDWEPGPYPRTPEQRAAAAKKYGLRVEDYEPYPDDGFGQGDYPMLPMSSENSRSFYENWDIPEMKRNFGDPVHRDADAIKEAYWDASAKYVWGFKQQLLWFVTVVGGLWAIYLFLEAYPNIHAAGPKRYLNDGRKLYTFEPVE